MRAIVLMFDSLNRHMLSPYGDTFVDAPNFARLVYDGDGSTGTNPEGPPGSGFVEKVHTDWFDAQGQVHEPIPFDGRSDYVGFTDEGIPAGGIFSGAEDEKTPQQEEWYGGDAGAWLDPCYHQACDNLSTVFTGVMPLSAEGLAPDGTDADKRAARRKPAGGGAPASTASNRVEEPLDDDLDTGEEA